MAGGFEESTSTDPHNSSYYGSSNSSNNDVGSFECNICFELAQDPIVTLCGHLYCWPCLYQWLHCHAYSLECPVCKAVIEEDKLVPLYGRGKNSTDPRSRSPPGVDIPHRPAGQRPSSASQPDPNQFTQANPWLMGGTPLGSTRFGNFTFSAAIGGLFPMLTFQVHGIPEATSYGPAAARYPYSYPPPHTFNGAYPRQVNSRQQFDLHLKALLIVIGALVVASLVWF